MRLEISEVRKAAEGLNWIEIDYQDNIKLISFKKAFEYGDVRINIYLTKGTISTSMNHPTRGKTQLHRRNQSMERVVKLLNNPRLHTGRGYYKRQSK